MCLFIRSLFISLVMSFVLAFCTCLLTYVLTYLLTYLLTCVLIIEPTLINLSLCVWVRACVHRLAPLWGNGSSSVQPVLSGMSQACRESLSESRVLQGLC